MRNKKKPAAVKIWRGGMEWKKSPLTRGMSRFAESIDELVESVEAK